MSTLLYYRSPSTIPKHDQTSAKPRPHLPLLVEMITAVMPSGSYFATDGMQVAYILRHDGHAFLSPSKDTTFRLRRIGILDTYRGARVQSVAAITEVELVFVSHPAQSSR